MIARFLLGLSLFWLIPKAGAQEIAPPLKGIVVQTDDKGAITPLAGAVVHWLHTNVGTSSDSNGVFFIPFHPTAKKLVVQALGFAPDTVYIKGDKVVKVVMVNKNYLNEVSVSYSRSSTEISFIEPWKTSTMNEKELFKAACCNLSESFETNPSVDVSYTDALSGTKQIQLLGLGGQYTQLTQEAMPGARALSTNFGLTYTPGTWISSIQIGKGAGSVVNGFESVAGQMNVELRKPDDKEKVFFNAYINEAGRFEANIVVNQKENAKFSHSTSFHVSSMTQRMDRNNDGFLDNPLGYQLNGMYRFKFDNQKGLLLQGGVRFLEDLKVGGAIDFQPNNYDTSRTGPYGTRVSAQRSESWFKLGYVFPRKRYKSVGLQLQSSVQDFQNYYGVNLYRGTQESGFANLIYQSIISNSDHRFRTGFSAMIDNFHEDLTQDSAYIFKRKEVVTGAFFEYTFSYLAKFTAVAGVRADYHNLFGMQYTPRLHLRYAISERTVLRASVGSGWRTANLIIENSGLLASNRRWLFPANAGTLAFGFNPEKAWNYGANATHEFTLNYRKGTVTVDAYRTVFTQQVVVDREHSPQQLLFYQLNGSSFSNSFQAQVDYEPMKRFSTRLAYRYYDVQMHYKEGFLKVPMIAKHRAFLNLAYATKNKWSVDVTEQWIGRKRLPSTLLNPEEIRFSDYSPSFWTTNVQVTKTVKKKWDFYVGVENLFDFRQSSAILDAAHPFGNYFDASMIWGPVFGRMTYAGMRFKI